MTNITEYLAEAAHYIDEGSRSIVEHLTDAHFAALCEASDLLNGGCRSPGIDNDLVRTYETFADFDASRQNHWRERGYRDDYEVEGYPAVLFGDVQMIKGQPRSSFIVIDLGDYRVVVK